MPKFIAANRDQPLLLPPDLRDRVPEGDLAPGPGARCGEFCGAGSRQSVAEAAERRTP